MDKTYYIYTHKDIDGLIFYIGAGTMNRGKNSHQSVYSRAYNNINRSKSWHKKAVSIDYQFTVDIIFHTTSIEKCKSKERLYIKNFKDAGYIVNIGIGGEGFGNRTKADRLSIYRVINTLSLNDVLNNIDLKRLHY